MSIILAMNLVKNIHMIVTNTTVPSQVIASQANTMVMDLIEGDVDMHSHVVPIATTMTT